MPYGTVNADKMTTSDGVSSAGLYGFKNRIINGDMRIDQRNAGASVTPNFSYTLDRWYASNTQTGKFTVQQNAGSVTPPTGFTKYLGVTSSSSYSVTSTDTFVILQKIEGLNCSDLAWGTSSAATVTLSFWVRSSLTGTFGGSLQNSDSSRSYPFTFTVSSANTWEQKTITIAGDTTGTWLTTNAVGIIVNFGLGSGSTFNSGTAGVWSSTNTNQPSGTTSVVGTNGATFYITGVQLEKGSTATSFDYLDYGRSLIQCQRYFEQLSSAGGFNALGGAGVFQSTTQFRAYINYQWKRTSPTFTSSAASTFVCVGVPGNLVASAISLGAANSSAAWVNFTVSGATAGQAGFTADNNSNTAFLGFSAEL